MFRFNFVRLAVAVSLVALIGSQLPQSNGIAMAADDYNIGGSSSSTGVIQGAIIALFGLGVVDGFGSKGGTAAAAPTGVGGAGAGTGGGAVPPVLKGEKPIYDVTGTDPDLSAFYKNETVLQDNNQSIGPTPSRDVLKAADNNKTKYTVFAPIDAAISGLNPVALAGPMNPQNATDTVSAQNLTTVSKLFSYHIIASRVLSINDLKALPGATSDPGAALVTMDGSSLYVKFTPGATATELGVLQISNAPFGTAAGSPNLVVATVRQTDEHASNGIIHPIDAVLIPASISGAAAQ